MPIDIRPYAPEDCPAVVALFSRAVHQLGRRDYSEAQVRAWAPGTPDLGRWATLLGERETWTAWIGQRLAGFADLEADGHLDHLYVDPDFERRGVARALYEQVVEAAQRKGLARLYTEASITALPAFNRFGFCTIEGQIVHVRGQEFLNFRMARRLDGAAAGP